MMKFLNPIIILVLLYCMITSLFSYQYGRQNSPENLHFKSVKDQYAELDCLTENLYYEATSEGVPGMVAVAQVTIQRKDSGKFADTLCKVVHQKSQFSWTSNKPKALINVNKEAYNNAREVAKKVLWENERISSINDSTYYYADYINQPYWAKNMKVVSKIGHHIFLKE